MRIRFCIWWMCDYNNAFRFDEDRDSKHSVGLGQTINYSFQEFLESNLTSKYYISKMSASSGNGSIMRLAPIPLFYHDEMDKAIKVSELHSKTTHPGEEAADCCKLMSFIIIKALYFEIKQNDIGNIHKIFLDSLNFSEIIPKMKTDSVKYLALSKVQENIQKDQFNKEQGDWNWDWKSPDFTYSPTRTAINPGYVGSFSVDALAMSLHCIYYSQTLEQCLINITNMGGDADSVGSIAGQILGSLYGFSKINNTLKEYVLRWDKDYSFLKRAMCLVHKNLLDLFVEGNSAFPNKNEEI